MKICLGYPPPCFLFQRKEGTYSSDGRLVFLVVGAYALNRDVLIVVTAPDTHVTVGVDLYDFVRSLARGREFSFSRSLVRFLDYEYEVAYFVGVVTSSTVLLLVVGDGLAAALQFQKLPVDFHLLPENHVHAKHKLAGIVG